MIFKGPTHQKRVPLGPALTARGLSLTVPGRNRWWESM